MKFSEMKYSRPDMEKIKCSAKQTAENLRNARSAEEAKNVYDNFNAVADNFATMNTLTLIRHSINTEDEFYDKENEFFDEANPMYAEYVLEVNKALAECPVRAELENIFGSLMFKNIDISLKAFSPEIIPEMQEDNRLTTEYQKLIASAQVDFRGEKRTLSELTPFKQSADDSIRHSAWAAESNFYSINGDTLDRIFDDMAALRDKMAKKMGYENYVPLGYCNMLRNDYTEEDIKKFRESVIKYLVPAADSIYREQAKRTGVNYPLKYSDTPLGFRSGNALPKGTADDILNAGKKFYHELSPETAEFIDFMFDNELMDVLSRKGKAAGGYCTDIPDYKSEFIFANFNGTAGDVEVITHEAGHAFAGYTARDIYPSDLRSPTMESCEIHSMSMEFFAWKWAEDFFGNDADKFRYQHLCDAIKFIPYGTMVDHFQHIVYENPSLTPKERHDEWKKLTKIYMPWIDLDGSPFYGEGRAWQRQIHIYENPFYYIDYCLAQTASLQFWALMQNDFDGAWERYMKVVREGGRKTYSGLIALAGFDSPFAEGGSALKIVADAAMKWLSEHEINE